MQDPSAATSPQTLGLDAIRPGKHRGWFYVIQTGLLTTALALGGVYLLASGKLLDREFDVLSFFFFYIVPVGAIGVGVAAGIGYAWAAWYAGYKPGRIMLAVIVVIQIAAYFLGQYIQFRQNTWFDLETGEYIGFWKYFHILSTSWVMRNSNGSPDDHLGLAGYFLQVLSILAFAAGAMLVPLFQSSQPYCEDCRLYKKSRLLGAIPASVPLRRIADDDTMGQQAYEAEQESMLENAKAMFERIVTAIADADSEGLFAELDELKSTGKGAAKLPVRIDMNLQYCPGCWSGSLSSTIVIGQGEEIVYEPLPTIPIEAGLLEKLDKR